MGELAALLVGGASSTPKIESLLASVVDDIAAKLLKDESEDVLGAALETFQGAAAEARRWAAANAKAKNAKIAATERLVAALAAAAHAAAVLKSRQGDALTSTYRGPRFDSGQPLCVLERAAPRVWRDVLVVHGGPLLCAIGEHGEVVSWGARAVELTGTTAQVSASDCVADGCLMASWRTKCTSLVALPMAA